MNRDHIHRPGSLGAAVADKVVTAMGSWGFIIIQTAIVLCWILYNLFSGHPYDVFPFILLNLLFSTQAAYASPLILMSQNRQAEKDQKRDNQEAEEVLYLFESHKLLSEMMSMLVEVNKQQLEILEELHKYRTGQLL